MKMYGALIIPGTPNRPQSGAARFKFQPIRPVASFVAFLSISMKMSAQHFDHATTPSKPFKIHLSPYHPILLRASVNIPIKVSYFSLFLPLFEDLTPATVDS
jgi:hypothetical protein